MDLWKSAAQQDQQIRELTNQIVTLRQGLEDIERQLRDPQRRCPSCTAVALDAVAQHEKIRHPMKQER